ncbi:MAG: hypothetical protein AB1765_10930 [Candidatus Hydrogenedentota bacterium]
MLKEHAEKTEDMIDYAKSTVEEVRLFKIIPNIFIKDIINAIANAAKEITCSITLLNDNPQAVEEHVVRAKKAENFIEHRYREALAELFNSTDVIFVLKYREVYRHLSNAADRCNEAANIISDIVVKTS